MRTPPLVLAFLLFATVAAAGPGTASPDSVHLHFGWKPGMVARVHLDGSRSRTGTGRDTDVRMRTSWRLAVRAHAQGLRLTTDSVRVEDAPAPTEQALQRVMAMAPDQIVSPAGGFVKLEDLAAYRANTRALLDSLLSGLEIPAGMRAMLDNASSDAALQSGHADQWNSLVGFWTGADLEVGTTVETEMEGASPVLPGVMIPQHMTFGATRRVPCGGDPRGCVELQLTTAPDSARFIQAMRSVVGQMAPAVRDSVLAAIGDMQVVNEVVLVTRPDGMLPESLRKVKRVTVRTRDGGTTSTAAQEDVRTTRFEWLR